MHGLWRLPASAVLLVVCGVAHAAEPFIGRWAINPVGCTIDGDTSETAPLVATATTIKWFVASCKIAKMYKTGSAVHIQARCSAEGQASMTPITLDARGDRMRVTWDGSKVEDMRRCK